MKQFAAAAVLLIMIAVTMAATWQAGRLDGIRHTLEDSRVGCVLTGNPEHWMDHQQIFLRLDGREFLLGEMKEFRLIDGGE